MVGGRWLVVGGVQCGVRGQDTSAGKQSVVIARWSFCACSPRIAERQAPPVLEAIVGQQQLPEQAQEQKQEQQQEQEQHTAGAGGALAAVLRVLGLLMYGVAKATGWVGAV